MDDTTNNATPARPKREGRAYFPLGRTMSTPGALAAIPPDEMLAAMARHAAGDWGECGPEDWAESELSLCDGFRLLSVYHTADGVTFWVITEADRSLTTVLLPDEY